MRLLRRPDAYDPRRPFKAWISTVARNLCHDRFRRESTRARYQSHRHPRDAVRSAAVPPWLRTRRPPSDETQEIGFAECIAELPAKFRDVVRPVRACAA